MQCTATFSPPRQGSSSQQWHVLRKKMKHDNQPSDLCGPFLLVPCTSKFCIQPCHSCLSPAPCVDATIWKVRLYSYKPTWPWASFHPAQREPVILLLSNHQIISLTPPHPLLLVRVPSVSKSQDNNLPATVKKKKKLICTYTFIYLFL